MLLLDVDKCVGCRTCETVCSLKHIGEENPARSRVKALRYEKMGQYHVTFPVVCQQCEDPMCMAVCPVNAIKKDSKTGAYLVNENMCVGCRICTIACPVGGIEVDPVTKVAVKCDLCEGDPICAKFCVPGAITYVPKDRAGLARKREAAKKISDKLVQIAGQK